VQVVAREAQEGVDALVHECTFDAPLKDKAVLGGHSTSHMAGEFAAQIRAKLLILTHFSQRFDKGAPGEPTVADLVSQASEKCPNSKVVAAEDLTNFNL